MNMKILMTSVFLFVMAFSQSVTVSGFVTDIETGEALSGANVFLKNTNLGAATNLEGYFAIRNVPIGEQLLVANYIGYEINETKIQCLPSKNLRIDIELIPASILGEEIEVTAEREKFKQEILTSRISISPAKLRTLPQMGESDLFRMIQLLPGVRAQSEFSSGLIVRGGNTDQNLILFDGITVYNPSHLGGVFSNFITDGLRNAELVKGAYPAQYGGRLSSVLDIRSKYGNSKKIAGSGEISLISSKALIEGPLGKGGFLLTARRTYIDKMLDLMKRNNLIKFTLPYYFYDLQGNIYQDLTPNDRLSFSLYSGNDKLDWEDAMMEFDWGNRTISSRWRHLFSETLFSNFLVADSWFWINVNMGNTIEEDDDIHDRTVKADLTWFQSKGNQIKFGFEAKDLDIHYLATFQDTIVAAEIHQKPTYAAIYYDLKTNANRWIFNSGLRLNYYENSPEKFSLSPRFSAKYFATEKTALTFSMGKYFQHLFTMNDEFSPTIISAWIAQDSSVESQNGLQWIFGIEHQNDPFSLTIESYAKTMNNLLVYRESRAGFDEDAFSNPKVSDIFTPTDAFACGSEFFLEKKRGEFTGNVSYALSFVMKEIEDEPRYWANWDRRHEFKTSVIWNANQKWQLGGSFQYGTGYPYTRMLGTYIYFEPGFSDMPTIETITGTRNNERLPDYHRLDLSVTRHFSGKHLSGDFFLNILNVYNRRNVMAIMWDTDSLAEGEAAEKEELRMLPILPTIGFRINF